MAEPEDNLRDIAWDPLAYGMLGKTDWWGCHKFVTGLHNSVPDGLSGAIARRDETGKHMMNRMPGAL
jgi:hypothetical protein